MHVILNSKPLEEADCFLVPRVKWQLMEDAKWMWYTDLFSGIEHGANLKVC